MEQAEQPTFETERIQELKNERIYLQKKIFTKWMNTFLQDDSKVDDLFEDLSDGRVLIRLLESISGERVGRIARGKQRIHKLENVSKSLTFLQKSVKLESIGPEDVVDGKQDLILGLIWMIILRFQISKVENENGSQDAKSAKEALLLWCQRKTKGYPGVDIKNFTTSWRNGLAFNALIHKHRPDLLNFSKLHPQQHRSNLGTAFDIAEQKLGVAKILDPEDLDNPRLDEKSVMTYVSMLYQCFAKMKHEETGGKRVAKILDVIIDIDNMKRKYTNLVQELLDWIAMTIKSLDANVPKTNSLLQKSMNEFKALRSVEKPQKYKERANIEELFFVIQTKRNAYRLRPYCPPDGKGLKDINIAWQQLEKGEHQREIRLREELARQERLSQLVERFEKKARLRESWLDDMLAVIETEKKSKSLQVSDASVSLKRHEALEIDVKARELKIKSVNDICTKLSREMYEGFHDIQERQDQVSKKWKHLLGRLQKRRVFLVTLCEVTPIVSETEKVCSQLKEAKVNMSTEETRKDHNTSDDQLQKHKLLESQLNAHGGQIQMITSSCNELIQKKHPHSTLLQEKLQFLTKNFEDVVRSSNFRRKRLEEYRDFNLFKETVKKENAFIQEKAQLAASREVGKDLVSLTRLQTKLQGLEAEIDACEARCDTVCKVGFKMISAKNSSSEDIQSIIDGLQANVENLKSLAWIRAERLVEASQSFQYYSDANEVESWIDERMQLLASEDFGKDKETAKSLLQRHKQITEEIIAFNEDIVMLQDECKQIEETDNKTEQNIKEASPKQILYDEIEVETETEDEEPVEKEVEQKIMKEFQIPQVSAKYAYTGEGLSMKKGEIFYLAAKTNNDWWSVRRVNNKESGYVPAAYIKEIEPKFFRKPVIEKVKVVENVKVKKKKMKRVKVERKTKEKLTDKRAKRSSSILRRSNKKRERKPRFTQHFDRENVTTRHLAIVIAYSKLKSAAEERDTKLREALAYFEFCSVHDQVMAWIEDQIRYLERWTTFGENIDFDTIKKLLERTNWEISANEKLFKDVEQKGREILEKESLDYRGDVENRLCIMLERYKELNRIKTYREEDLMKSHGVEMFSKLCDEVKSWIVEKSNQLTETPVGSNQETIRTLQRKHQNFEQEMFAIGDKIKQLKADFTSLRNTQPTTLKEVRSKENDVYECWALLKAKAAARKNMLQEAYGYQGFLADYRDMVVWSKDVSNRFSQRDLPKDLSVVEDLLRAHNEALTETEGNIQRIADLIKSGQALISKSATSEDVHGLLEELLVHQKNVPELWQARERQLSSCKNALMFHGDADSFISKTIVIQKLLSTDDTGASMENVTTLLKQVEEISQKVSQLEEKLKKLVANADEMIETGHYDSSLIAAKKEEALSSLHKTLKLLRERRKILEQSQDFQQFRGDVEEFLSWTDDKLALANDESYKDLSSLQSKVLKHQALQAEIISNAVSKKRLEQAGEEMIAENHVSSEEIKNLLQNLDDNWDQLDRSSRVKQQHLEQATTARAFSSAFDDFDIWCDQIKVLLSSKDFGDDLATVRFLRNKQLLYEKDIKQRQQDLCDLERQAEKMHENGNFRSKDVLSQLDAIKKRMVEIIDASKSRSLSLVDAYALQQFLFEVNVQLSWIEDHLAQVENSEYGTDLTATQRLLNRHEAMENELKSHSAIITKLAEKGNELIKSRQSCKEIAQTACQNLEQSLRKLQKAASNRQRRILEDRDAFQFLLDANEIENWLEEKKVNISGLQQGKDLDAAERQLRKANNLTDEFRRNKKNIESFIERATTFDLQDSPKRGFITEKYQKIEKDERTLFALLQKSQAKLENLHKVYQFFYDAENVRGWLSEKLKVAGAEGYGKDFEHWQVLTQKFDDFKVSVAAGKFAYESVIKLADDVIAAKGPHAPNVSNAKGKLSAMWSKLMEKVQQKKARLVKAGGLHKFNMQVSDILSNLKEKESTISAIELGEDVASSESKVRAHDTAVIAIEAVGKQIEEVELSGNELTRNYPGKTAEQIQMHQAYVKKVWSDVLRKANNNKGKLHGSVDYHRLNSEIARLLLWCQEAVEILNAKESLETVDEVEEAMDSIDDLKLEIDGKEEKFAFVIQAGEQMVEEGHYATEEIQEKLEELLTNHDQVHDLWLICRQHLTELYDYTMFCREVARINGVINSYKNFLNTISDGHTGAGAEIESLLKRVQKLKNMVDSHSAKIETALELGEQLLSDKHFASDKVKDLAEDLMSNRDEFNEELVGKEKFLKDALDLAKYRQDNYEITSWIVEKLSDIRNRKVDAFNLGLYSTIHKSDLVELKSHNVAKEALRSKGEEMVASEHFSSGEVEDCLLDLYRQFELLEKEINEMGKTLEDTKYLTALKGDVDFAEAHIIEKERKLATDETGDDYDKCQILQRQLENTTKDMKADEGRMHSINEKAKALAKCKPSELCEEISMHFRMLNSRWENLRQLAASRKNMLDKAARFLLFKRNAEEVEVRMNEKISKLTNCSIAADLNGVQMQMRRHMQLESDLEAIELSLETLDSDARDIARESPESMAEIQDIQTGIIEVWENLIELNENRQANLQAAEHLYRFQTDVSSLSSWMKKARERLSNISQSRNVKETKGMLDMHKQIVSALAVREEVFARVKKYGQTLASDGCLEPSDVFPKLKQLDEEKAQLQQLLQKKKVQLKETFDLQRFGSELDQIESWLDRRTETLDNENLGTDLEDVERLLIQHDNMKGMMGKFQETIDSLRSFADEMGRTDSQQSVKMSQRYQHLRSRVSDVKQHIDNKLLKLKDSLLYFKFLGKTNEIILWAENKVQYAKDSSEDISESLQSTKKVFDAVLAEMTANRRKKDETIAEANTLVNRGTRVQDVQSIMSNLSDIWNELEKHLAKKGRSLGERIALEKVEASLREFIGWLERSETALQAGDLGTSLESSTVLQAKHGEIENEITNKEKQLQELDQMIDNNIAINKSLSEGLRGEYDDICDRFAELHNITEQRKQDLIYSVEFHSLSQEAEDEMSWIREKAVHFESPNLGADLTDAKHIFKKHQMLESEIASHDNIVSRLLKKLEHVVAETIFEEELENVAKELRQEWIKLKTLAQDKNKKIRENIHFLKYNADVKQAVSWLKDHLPALKSKDRGKDESSATAMLRKVSVQENNIEAFRKTIEQLESRLGVMMESEWSSTHQRETAIKLQENLDAEYKAVSDLCVSSKTRLKESIQHHRFNRVVDMINAWIDEKSPTASASDFGETLKQTLVLLKTFEDFMSEMKGYELEVAKIQDMVGHDDFKGHSDIEIIKSKAELVRTNFMNLQARSLDRLKRLNNTKKVHEFSEIVQETLQWINRKENDIINVNWSSGLLALADLRKKQDSFILDLHALNSKVTELNDNYASLNLEMPDEAIDAGKEIGAIEGKMQNLLKKVQLTSEKLSKAEELKTFLQASEDLRVWIGDRVAAIESNVRSLMSKAMDHDDAYVAYRDHLTEKDARKSRFDSLMKDGMRIIDTVFEIQGIVESEIGNLQQDWQNLNLELKGFHEDLKHTEHSESLKDDLVNLDKWIAVTSEGFEDVEGTSLDDIEELLRNQDDLEKSIAVQEERFQSTLGKLSKYTEKFGAKYAKRHSLDKESISSDRGNASNKEERENREFASRNRKEISVSNKIQEVLPKSASTTTYAEVCADKASQGPANRSRGFENSGVKVKAQHIGNAAEEKTPKQDEETGLLSFKENQNTEHASIENNDLSQKWAEGSMSVNEEHLQSRKLKDEDKISKQLENIFTDPIPKKSHSQSTMTSASSHENQRSSDKNYMEELITPIEMKPAENAPALAESILQYVDSVKDTNVIKNEDNKRISDGIFELDMNKQVDENMNQNVSPKAIENSSDFVTEFSDDEENIEFVFEQPAESGNEKLFSLLAEMGYDDEASDGGIKTQIEIADDSQDRNSVLLQKEIEDFAKEFATEKDDIGYVKQGEVIMENPIVGALLVKNESLVPDRKVTDRYDGKSSVLHGSIDLPLASNPFEFENENELSTAPFHVDSENELTSEKMFFSNSAVNENLGMFESPRLSGMKEPPVLDIKLTENIVQSKSVMEDYKGGASEKQHPKDNVNTPSVPVIVVSRASRSEEGLMGGRNEGKLKTNVFDFAGHLEFKEKETSKAMRISMRKWREFYVVISENTLILHQSETAFKQRNNPLKSHILEDVLISVEPTAQTNDDLLRLQFADKTNYQIRSADKEVLDDFLMAVTECTQMNSKEDTVSLPPAPPPPQLPMDAAEIKKVTSQPPQLPKDAVEINEVTSQPVLQAYHEQQTSRSDMERAASGPTGLRKTKTDVQEHVTVDTQAKKTQQDYMKKQKGSANFQSRKPELQMFEHIVVPDPELSTDESDEFDDVIPPPAPVLSIPSAARPDSRKMSLGILEIVGGSTAFSDNSSDDEDDRGSRESSTFDPDMLDKRDIVKEERPPRKISNMNKWFSRAEESFADETTPITPFGEDTDPIDFENEFTTGDLSEALGYRPKVDDSDGKEGNGHKQTQSNERPDTLNLPSAQSSHQKGTFDKSPSSPGKELKKKGFLGGIFKKRK